MDSRLAPYAREFVSSAPADSFRPGGGTVPRSASAGSPRAVTRMFIAVRSTPGRPDRATGVIR